MIHGKRILGLIPARGGSKGLLRKNLREINGLPLIAWTIKQGLASSGLSKLIVSTDDPEIAEVSKHFGADVPFMRPSELALDDSPTIDVVRHVLENLNDSIDVVCLLEPTSPLRKTNDINDGLYSLGQHWDNTDAVVSLGTIHLENPFICKIISEQGYLQPILHLGTYCQRQQLPHVYFPYGVLYVVKVESFNTEHSFYPCRTRPYFIERWQNYEIDDELDLVLVETIMRRYMSS